MVVYKNNHVLHHTLSAKSKRTRKYYERDRIFGELPTNQEVVHNAVSEFAHPNMWIIPQERPNNFIPVKWGLMTPYKLGADAEAYYKETIC